MEDKLNVKDEEAVQSPSQLLHEVARANLVSGGDSEETKSQCSGSSKILKDGKRKLDDRHYPGITDMYKQVKIEKKPYKEEDEMKCESVGDGQKPTGCVLRCRTIRIGSYRVYPSNVSYIPVTISTKSISFRAPDKNDSSKCVQFHLRGQDITRVLAHLGRCLPIMYIYATSEFGNSIRSAFCMDSAEKGFFDPTSGSDKTKIITFLYDTMTDEDRNFLRHCFLDGKKLKEIDTKTANEILVRTTPN